MYLPLLALLVSSVHGFSSCNRGNWNHARSMFNQISNDVINYDHDIREACKHFSQFAAQEIFGKNAFRLEVMLSGYDSATWDVRIRHRTIYISGHYPQQGSICDLTYGDIKVLPEFVDTHGAVWMYSSGMFVVAFPYKYTLDSNTLCNMYIDDTLIHVRRGFPTNPLFQ